MAFKKTASFTESAYAQNLFSPIKWHNSFYGWRLSFFKRTIGHRPRCPMSHTSSQMDIAGFIASFQGRLLATTIRFAFDLRRGAGGCSISPSIVFSPLVCSESPAFAVLDKLGCWFLRTPSFSQQCDDIVTELRNLFINGKASPCDRTLEGGNL